MSTIANKLLIIRNAKQLIKDAIEEHGVIVGNTRFMDYPNLIRQIEVLPVDPDPVDPDPNDSNNPYAPVDPDAQLLSVGSSYRGDFTSSNYIDVDYQNNITYNGLVVTPDNSKNGGACISLGNCNNVIIENCYFRGTTRKPAIKLYKCSNVTIKNCFFENIFQGVLVQECSDNIKIDNNEFLNITGKLLTEGDVEFILYRELGNAIQFDKVNGAGHSVSFNAIENEIGVSFPEDIINMYETKGISGSPITIEGN